MPVITSRNLWEDVLLVNNSEKNFYELMQQSSSPPSDAMMSMMDEVHITNIGESEIIWTDNQKRSIQTTLEGHILFPSGTIILKGKNNVTSLKMISLLENKIVCSIRGY